MPANAHPLDPNLPQWLSLPLSEGAISLAEASEMWDLWSRLKPGEEIDLPPHLEAMCDRMELWAWDVTGKVPH